MGAELKNLEIFRKEMKIGNLKVAFEDLNILDKKSNVKTCIY